MLPITLLCFSCRAHRLVAIVRDARRRIGLCGQCTTARECLTPFAAASQARGHVTAPAVGIASRLGAPGCYQEPGDYARLVTGRQRAVAVPQ